MLPAAPHLARYCGFTVAHSRHLLLQIIVLYPLDTIKVRCQANNMAAKEVVAELLATCRTPGSLVASLYAGVMGAALCSVLVGAVHYAR